MEIGSIIPSAAEWPAVRQECYEFMRRFGSKRLTLAGCTLFRRLSYEDLALPGTSLVAATVRGEEGRTPIGISFTAGYGMQACLVAVHPLYRSRRIGTALLRTQLSRLGKLNFRVPGDHYAALKMCFYAGMRAEGLETDLTGKAAFILNGEAVRPAGNEKHNPDTNQEGELLCLSPLWGY